MLVCPHFLFERSFLVSHKVFPYILDPADRQVRHQPSWIEGSGKFCSYLQFNLLRTSRNSCSELGVSFLFLCHLTFQVSRCLLAEWFYGWIGRMIQHLDDFKPILAVDNLCSEKFQLWHKYTNIVDRFRDFIPVWNFLSTPHSVLNVNVFRSCFFLKFLVIRHIFLFQAVGFSALLNRTHRYRFILIKDKKAIPDNRIVTELVDNDQI